MSNVEAFVVQREQLQDHEEMVLRLEAELEQHRRHIPERGAKALSQQNYKEKDAYLHYEVCIQQWILVTISASLAVGYINYYIFNQGAHLAHRPFLGLLLTVLMGECSQ